MRDACRACVPARSRRSTRRHLARSAPLAPPPPASGPAPPSRRPPPLPPSTEHGRDDDHSENRPPAETTSTARFFVMGCDAGGSRSVPCGCCATLSACANRAADRVVAVVGAGISGLAAAHRLRQQLPDAEVMVLEASPRIGGSLRTAEVGGVVVDVGAEAMLNRRPEAVALAREVGLADDLVHPATISASLWNRGDLVPMPRTLMGVPVDLRALDGCDLRRRGWPGRRMDTVLPATRLDGRDISVGDLVEERLGDEVVDRLVEPLLGGVYAGHAREISARAAVPAARRAARPRPLAHPRCGGRHPTARRLAPRCSPASAGASAGCPQRSRRASRRYRPHRRHRPRARPPVRGRLEPRRRLRPASPRSSRPTPWCWPRRPAPTARLLSRRRAGRGAGPGPDRVRLDGDRDARLPGAGVPGGRRVGLPGAAGRRPGGEGGDVLVRQVGLGPRRGRRLGRVRLVLRCSLGRHREEQTLQRDDDELVDLALADLTDAIGLSVAARRHRTCSGGAARCRSTPSGTSTGWPRSATSSSGCRDSRSAARRTTEWGSRPASPPPTVAAAKVLGGPCDNGSMTSGRRRRASSTTRSATRCGRCSGCATCSARTPTATRRPPRSRSSGRQARGRRRRGPRRLRRSAVCAPTPT